MTSREDWDLRRGERHWAWVGQDASYQTAHERVSARRGPASGYPCADCGRPARHWSYDHSDPDERTSDDGQPYSLDVNRYAPRCVRCHKRMDCARLIEERGGNMNAVPRCGKPIRSARILAHLGEGDPPPVCGRPFGHAGRCSLPGTHQRTLERNRQRHRAQARGTVTPVAPPRPRCGQPIRVANGTEPDTCGRPEGHSGQHNGTRAYRRALDWAHAVDKQFRSAQRVSRAAGEAS
jgi:hypothetical protein